MQNGLFAEEIGDVEENYVLFSVLICDFHPVIYATFLVDEHLAF